MFQSKLLFLEAVAILVGTIIGAGILGIPYVIAKAGFLTGVVNLVIIALAIILVNLFLGEIVLSTQNRYQLTGYAAKYLGTTGKYLMLTSMIFGFYGALLVYIIGEGEVLAQLTGGNPFWYSLLFFIFGSLLIYLGLSVVKKFELLMTLAVLIIVVVISLWSFRVINLENLMTFNFNKLFLPYGVIFFAMSGSSAIPLLRYSLKGKEQQVKKAIIVGVTIPFIVYLLFSLIVVGVTGPLTTEIATIGLGRTVSELMLIIGNLFAFFTMATSFLTIGLALKETYFFDLRLKYKLACVLACLPPFIAFLLGLNNFIGVIGTAGAIAGGLEGLVVLAIYLKLKSLKTPERKPEYNLVIPKYVIALLGILFIGGIIYTFWSI